MSKLIYLDYAAATPTDQEVIKTMQQYLLTDFYNPSADYSLSRQVKNDLNLWRSKIAYYCGAQASEIIFTAGGTEANNLAIKGIMDQFKTAKLLVSAIEHESILQPAMGYNHRLIKVDANGLIDLNHLMSLVDDEVALISIMYVNNEIGTIEPLKKIASLIHDIRLDRRRRNIQLPLYFHTDACQAANYLDIHVNRLGVDLMTINGGKIYGPKQSGVLYVKRGINIKPLIEGGGQENNIRSGTENVAADIGLAVALTQAQEIYAEENTRLSQLREKFIQGLKQEISNVTINGSLKFRIANNVHISIAHQDNERLLIGLDQLGIMAASGSACSASKDESSHVLLAIGLNEEQARSSLRFSLGKSTTNQDIAKAIDSLKSILA